MAFLDEFWLVDFGEPFPGEPAHHRPALLVGPPDEFGPEFPFVLVVPLTTTWRGLALHVEAVSGPETGLDETSYIQCELIRSINRARLVHRLGRAPVDVVDDVTTVLKTLLSL